MQSNKVVSKFRKGSKQEIMEDKEQSPVLRKGRKFNKPKRGGGIKGTFRDGNCTDLDNSNIYK